MAEAKHRIALRRRVRADLERQKLPQLIAVFLLAIFLLGLVLASLTGAVQEIYRREKRQTRLHAIGAISDSMQKALRDVQDVSAWIYAMDSEQVFLQLRQQPEQLRQQLAERIRAVVCLRSVSLYRCRLQRRCSEYLRDAEPPAAFVCRDRRTAAGQSSGVCAAAAG